MQCPFLQRQRTEDGTVLRCAAAPCDRDVGSRCTNEGFNYCRRYLGRTMGDAFDEQPGAETPDRAGSALLDT